MHAIVFLGIICLGVAYEFATAKQKAASKSAADAAVATKRLEEASTRAALKAAKSAARSQLALGKIRR